jgi:hypothetical protein
MHFFLLTEYKNEEDDSNTDAARAKEKRQGIGYCIRNSSNTNYNGYIYTITFHISLESGTRF